MLPLAASIKVVIHIELKMCALFNEGFFGNWVLGIWVYRTDTTNHLLEFHYQTIDSQCPKIELPIIIIVNWLLRAPAI